MPVVKSTSDHVIVITKTATCPSCRQQTTFTFGGNQEDDDGHVLFSLWNCGNCRSTISSSRLGE